MVYNKQTYRITHKTPVTFQITPSIPNIWIWTYCAVLCLNQQQQHIHTQATPRQTVPFGARSQPAVISTAHKSNTSL